MNIAGRPRNGIFEMAMGKLQFQKEIRLSKWNMLVLSSGSYSFESFSCCFVSLKDKPDCTLIYIRVGVSSGPPVKGHHDGIKKCKRFIGERTWERHRGGEG